MLLATMMRSKLIMTLVMILMVLSAMISAVSDWKPKLDIKLQLPIAFKLVHQVFQETHLALALLLAYIRSTAK